MLYTTFTDRPSPYGMYKMWPTPNRIQKGGVYFSQIFSPYKSVVRRSIMVSMINSTASWRKHANPKVMEEKIQSKMAALQFYVYTCALQTKRYCAFTLFSNNYMILSDRFTNYECENYPKYSEIGKNQSRCARDTKTTKPQNRPLGHFDPLEMSIACISKQPHANCSKFCGSRSQMQRGLKSVNNCTT